MIESCFTIFNFLLMEKYGNYKFKHAPLCLCASATFDIDNVDCILYLQFCSYKRYLYLDEIHCDQCMSPFTRYMINNITNILMVIKTTLFVLFEDLCPLVGTAGGSFYSDKGGASNTLCLSHNPEFLPDHFPVKYSPGEIGFLYGGEYQFSLKNVVIQDDVPCSVCRVNMATSAIMFPAKLSCPSGWKKQYSGLLTSERHDHTRSEYLCIDEDPDFIERSRVNENGRLFHPTLTVCGTLPCPPYRNASYVPCVVCSV